MYTEESYTCSMCFYVVQIQSTRRKDIVIGKVTDFTFCWKKEQMNDKNIKN